MKFLTKLGQIALQVTTGIQMFGPMAKAVAPDNVDRAIDRVADSSVKIANVIANAEVMGQALSLSGADKLKAVVPAAAGIFLASDALVGHKVKDKALFEAGVAKCMSGWADILNSLDEKSLDKD